MLADSYAARRLLKTYSGGWADFVSFWRYFGSFGVFLFSWNFLEFHFPGISWNFLEFPGIEIPGNSRFTVGAPGVVWSAVVSEENRRFIIFTSGTSFELLG